MLLQNNMAVFTVGEGKSILSVVFNIKQFIVPLDLYNSMNKVARVAWETVAIPKKARFGHVLGCGAVVFGGDWECKPMWDNG